MRTTLNFIPALCVGILSFVWLFGVERAAGVGGPMDWPGGDFSQHVAGAFAFLDGRWSWPIFYTDRLNHPDGVNVIFTDSAPFAGLVAKAVNTITGLRWNYLGTWFFVLWVGQAVGAAFLVFALGAKHWLPMTCSAIVALALPAFLLRHVHLALSSHFLILVALGLYFLKSDAGPLAKRSFLWLALLAVAVFTHAYIFAMAYAIFAASSFDGAYNKDDGIGASFGSFVAVSLAIITIAVAGGYLFSGTGGGVSGFDVYSMNLLSAVWPVNSFYFGGSYPWQQGGLEGFNYLGLAGLAAVAFAAGLAPAARSFVSRSPFLTITLLLLTMYSLGSTIRLGERVLLTLPTPDFAPFTVFRASGRFFWPVAYLLLMFAVATIWNNRSRLGIAAPTLLVVLATSQVVESLPWFATTAAGQVAPPLPLALTSYVEESGERISIYPQHGCAQGLEQAQRISQLAAFAARSGKTVNTVDSARAPRPAGCEIPDGDGNGHEVFLSQPPSDRTCTRVEEFYLCG